VLVELILLLSGFGASNTFFSFCAHQHWWFLSVQDVPAMEPWPVAACSMAFGTRIDKFIRDCLEDFDKLHPFSDVQSVGGFSKGLDHRDGVALP
jgi:hypothetical protein